MQKVQDLHGSAKEVLEKVIISQLAVKSMEEVAKRANRIAKWARKNAEMNSDDAKAIKDLAKEIQQTMDTFTKGSKNPDLTKNPMKTL